MYNNAPLDGIQGDKPAWREAALSLPEAKIVIAIRLEHVMVPGNANMADMSTGYLEI